MSEIDGQTSDLDNVEPSGADPIPAPGRSEDSPARITRASAAWVATGAALVLLVFLVVFILQNQTRVHIKFFGFDGTVPLGVAMLIAAIAGGSLVAVAGIARVMQLRRIVRKAKGAEPDRTPPA